MKTKLIFFRNDDIRDKLDDSLVQMTKLFIQNNIPISHAVEPANISSKVLEWLCDIKQKHSNFIEIVQHGYAHRLNYRKQIGGKIKKGEFGGDRTYQEQFDEIRNGQKIMDKYFGNSWFRLFTFPYGARNAAAIKAVSDSGFLAVNGSMGITTKHKYLYKIGQILNKEMLFGRKISWHLKHKPNTNLFQIDTSISNIKKFNDEMTNCEFYSFEDLKKRTQMYLKKNDVIGFVLHHRYENEISIEQLELFVKWLKSIPNIKFTTQEDIYKAYA